MTGLTSTEKLSVAAARMARAAPAEWDEFLSALRGYAETQRDLCVQASLDQLQVAQGRAQGANAILTHLRDAIATADRITQRTQRSNFTAR